MLWTKNGFSDLKHLLLPDFSSASVDKLFLEISYLVAQIARIWLFEVQNDLDGQMAYPYVNWEYFKLFKNEKLSQTLKFHNLFEEFHNTW